MVKISFFYISYLNLQDNINVSTMGTFVIFYQTIYTFHASNLTVKICIFFQYFLCSQVFSFLFIFFFFINHFLGIIVYPKILQQKHYSLP